MKQKSHQEYMISKKNPEEFFILKKRFKKIKKINKE